MRVLISKVGFAADQEGFADNSILVEYLPNVDREFILVGGFQFALCHVGDYQPDELDILCTDHRILAKLIGFSGGPSREIPGWADRGIPVIPNVASLADVRRLCWGAAAKFSGGTSTEFAKLLEPDVSLHLIALLALAQGYLYLFGIYANRTGQSQSAAVIESLALIGFEPVGAERISDSLLFERFREVKTNTWWGDPFGPLSDGEDLLRRVKREWSNSGGGSQIPDSVDSLVYQISSQHDITDGETVAKAYAELWRHLRSSE